MQDQGGELISPTCSMELNVLGGKVRGAEEQVVATIILEVPFLPREC